MTIRDAHDEELRVLPARFPVTSRIRGTNKEPQITEPNSTFAHIRTHDDNPYLNSAFNKVSWGAVFAGVAIGLVVQLLLNLLGAGIGAAVVDPASNDNPSATTLSLTTAVWFIVSGLGRSFPKGRVRDAHSRASVSHGREIV